LKTAGEFLGNLAESRVQQIGEEISKVQSPFEVVEAFRGLRT